MACAFDADRNEKFSLEVLYAKYDATLTSMREVTTRLNGGAALPVVPEEWDALWRIRFLVGFKEDPEIAGQAFFDAMQWRREKGVEGIRQKILAGMTPDQFPNASKVLPYTPKVTKGHCRLGLPVTYNFLGKSEPGLMFKAGSFDEILEYQIHEAEYTFNLIMTMSLEKGVMVRVQVRTTLVCPGVLY